MKWLWKANRSEGKNRPDRKQARPGPGEVKELTQIKRKQMEETDREREEEKTGFPAGYQPDRKPEKPARPGLNGFTLQEALLAMLIGIILCGICIMQAAAIRYGTAMRPDDQEQFAVLQIREIISLCQSVHTEARRLELKENGRTETLELDRGRLVKRPGYEIFMEDLEDAGFEARNGHLYLSYTRHGIRKTFQIG